MEIDLAKIRKKMGINQNIFADLINNSVPNYSRKERKEIDFGGGELETIINYIRLNDADGTLLDNIDELDVIKDTNLEDFKMVPLVRAVLSAGGGRYVYEEEAKRYYSFRLDWLKRKTASSSRVYLMEVSGNSMFPTLLDGDMVLIDPREEPIQSGRIYGLRVDDSLLVKRLYTKKGGVVLVAGDNKEDPAGSFEAQRDEITILGLAIWVGRELTK
ncbi:MAG: helix-turn-helix transcriptional regulator [Deltaproteobacteria bacterium]|nr:helix-turn-helix transcriptional regulator [Deltaproteobacteria bacterium]